MPSMADIQKTSWALDPFGQMGDPKTMAATANIIGESEKATAMENAAIAGATGHIRGAEEARAGQETAADLTAAAHKYAADQGLLGQQSLAGAHVKAALINAASEKATGMGDYYRELSAKAKAERDLKQQGEWAGQGTKTFLGEHGTPPATGTGPNTMPTDTPWAPGLGAAHNKMQALIAGGTPPDQAYTAVQPDLHQTYYHPELVEKGLNLMNQSSIASGQGPIPDAVKDQMRSGTPAAMQSMYPWTRLAAKQPQRWGLTQTLSPAPALGPQNLTPGAGLTPPNTGVVAP